MREVKDSSGPALFARHLPITAAAKPQHEHEPLSLLFAQDSDRPIFCCQARGASDAAADVAPGSSLAATRTRAALAVTGKPPAGRAAAAHWIGCLCTTCNKLTAANGAFARCAGAEGGDSEANVSELGPDEDAEEAADGDAAEFEAGSQLSEDDEATLDEEEASPAMCRALELMTAA